jgi:hemerythrin-like domain-containing protein
MKATDLLQKQHREIEQLLERLETAGPDEEKPLREALASHLVAHATIEEEIFYPAARQHAPDLVLEALDEHALADFQLARELGTRAGDRASRARATVLADVVVRHIRKEEAEMFRKVDAAITNQELAELGEHMATRFEEIRGKGFQRVLAAALAANMPKMMARPMAQKAATRQAAPAKKKARGRVAKAAPVKRTTARKPTARRATVKRAVKHSATAAPKARKTTRGARAGGARARATT